MSKRKGKKRQKRNVKTEKESFEVRKQDLGPGRRNAGEDGSIVAALQS